MDMPSAFPPGTDVNFASSSVFGCASSVCIFASSFFASSFFGSGVFACDFAACPRAAFVFGCAACCASTAAGAKPRSEEHTSELQSRLHLVCRLLLEKKKNIYSISTSMISMHVYVRHVYYL